MSLSFLHNLYTAYDPEDGHLCEIRCLDAKRQAEPVIRYFGLPRLDKAAEFARSQSVTHDVYVGVLPRSCKAPAGKGGRDCDVTRGGWLWCDVDRGEASDREMIEFLGHVKSRMPAPRLVVLSGSGGVHLYWQLAEVVALDTDQARADFGAVLRRLVLAIGSGSCGIHADKSCVNPSRILRLPHTLNHKHDPPRPVEAVICDPSESLTLAQWSERLPWEPMPTWKTRVKPPSYNTTSARRDGPPPGLLAWAERGYPEGNRHHDLVGAAAFLRRDTDLAENVAFDLLRIKADNSPGRRPITDDEIEKAWRWAQ